MSNLVRETSLEVILADAQLKIIEFLPDASVVKKDLIKAVVKAAWCAGHMHALASWEKVRGG